MSTGPGAAPDTTGGAPHRPRKTADGETEAGS